MDDKRKQGRPTRGKSEVGRELIVRKAREYLRNYGFAGMTKKHLAEHANVTPSLISYYFPQHHEFIEAVTLPILDHYKSKVISIAQSDENPVANFKKLIHLLIEFHVRDVAIIDCLQNLSEANWAELSGHLAKFLADAGGIVAAYLESLGAPTDEVDFIVVALWGMCRSVSNQPPGSLGHTHEPNAVLIRVDGSADRIYRLVTVGLKTQG